MLSMSDSGQFRRIDRDKVKDFDLTSFISTWFGGHIQESNLVAKIQL